MKLVKVARLVWALRKRWKGLEVAQGWKSIGARWSHRLKPHDGARAGASWAG